MPGRARANAGESPNSCLSRAWRYPGWVSECLFESHVTLSSRRHAIQDEFSNSCLSRASRYPGLVFEIWLESRVTPSRLSLQILVGVGCGCGCVCGCEGRFEFSFESPVTLSRLSLRILAWVARHAIQVDSSYSCWSRVRVRMSMLIFKAWL